ncbi:MAG: sigma-54 dependent transcriptional regulator [Bryobacteraceae bacterium]
MIRVVIISGQSALERPLMVTLGEGFHVRVTADRRAAHQEIARGQVDVVVVDLDTRFSALDDQFQFLDELRGSDLPVLVMTDDDRRSTALDLLQHGVYDSFRKPPSPIEMRIVIRRAHEHARLKAELAEMRRKMTDVTSCDELLGESPRMRAVYDLVHRVANLNSPILITGESGTGKELLARAIHNLGQRSGAPFVAVSCAALPDTLIEAELFGHEKGAFTGAATARRGLFEEAGQGTLFLDEIGELSLATQVKLLRVLQQKEFTVLGGNRTVPLRARVLLATHRDLEAMVAAGQFRRDLFFRINVLKIEMPALRERAQDIPILAYHFLHRYASSCMKSITNIDAQALAALTAYDWPGNIRELENIIHRAVILADTDTIGLLDLPEFLHHKFAAKTEDIPTQGSYEEVLREFKRNIAEKRLKECNGNKTLAANTLSISRAYLHRLLRETSELDAPG